MKTFRTIRAALLPVVVSTVLVTAVATRADDKDSKKSSDPTDTAACIEKAAQMNMATIRFGQLASQKAENAELKQFGQKLEQDHRKAQSDLEKIAKTQNVTLPTSLEAKCEEEIARLQKLSGSEFDREFAKGAVEGHAMAAANLQNATSKAKDADLRQYTEKSLAQVKEHQREARKIARAVGVDQATITSLENKAHEAAGAPGGARSETGQEDRKIEEKP
jgi:putative membrane protein